MHCQLLSASELPCVGSKCTGDGALLIEVLVVDPCGAQVTHFCQDRGDAKMGTLDPAVRAAADPPLPGHRGYAQLRGGYVVDDSDPLWFSDYVVVGVIYGYWRDLPILSDGAGTMEIVLSEAPPPHLAYYAGLYDSGEPDLT